MAFRALLNRHQGAAHVVEHVVDIVPPITRLWSCVFGCSAP